MRAAVLENRGPGGFQLRDFPRPIRQPGESILRVRAASLNRVDLYMRDVGVGITHTLPQVLGVEAAGEIVEADPDSGLVVGGLAVLYTVGFCGVCRYCVAGDQPLCIRAQIIGEHRHGSFAEYVAMPSKCFIPLPPGTNLVEASTLMSTYNTAWRMLFGKRALRPGECVLIPGIGGGVAVAGLLLALYAGARVIVTSSSDEKLARAAALGAFAGINYRTEPVAKRVLELTDGDGVDMVLETVGGNSWGESLRSLRRGGRIVTCGATAGSNPSADIQRLFIRQLEIYGSTGGSLEEFRELIGVYQRGGFKPIIDRTYPLIEIHAAFDRLARSDQFGKVVITVD